MIKQFKVVLFNIRRGLITHLVNANNAQSAQFIAEGIFDDMRVIEVKENV